MTKCNALTGLTVKCSKAESCDIYDTHCRMYTLFAKSLPLDVASRVWDVFCRDGEEFLFRTALGLFTGVIY